MDDIGENSSKSMRSRFSNENASVWTEPKCNKNDVLHSSKLSLICYFVIYYFRCLFSNQLKESFKDYFCVTVWIVFVGRVTLDRVRVSVRVRGSSSVSRISAKTNYFMAPKLSTSYPRVL